MWSLDLRLSATASDTSVGQIQILLCKNARCTQHDGTGGTTPIRTADASRGVLPSPAKLVASALSFSRCSTI